MLDGLLMLERNSVRKSPQGNRRQGVQETSANTAVAQFWVRNEGSQGECYLGKKELKEKSSTAGEEFCTKCFISGAATAKGWSHLAG